LAKHDLKIQDVIKFGKLGVDPIIADDVKVIHTRGHTPDHMSFLVQSNGGLVIPLSYFTLDDFTAAVSVMRVHS